MQNNLSESVTEEEILPKKPLKTILANFLEGDRLNLFDQEIRKAKKEMEKACFAFSSTLALQKKLVEVYLEILKKKSL